MSQLPLRNGNLTFSLQVLVEKSFKKNSVEFKRQKCTEKQYFISHSLCLLTLHVGGSVHSSVVLKTGTAAGAWATQGAGRAAKPWRVEGRA